jgi:hypothetical protein
LQTSIEVGIHEIKLVIEQIQREFTEPDDDFAPVALVIGEKLRTVVPMNIPNDEAKDIFANLVIPTTVRALEAWMVVLVLSAWTVEMTPFEGETRAEAQARWEDLGVMPSEHPNRKEIVVLSCITADEMQFWRADINRHKKKPPTLGAWKMASEKSGAEMSGRFIDPIIAVLRDESDAD